MNKQFFCHSWDCRTRQLLVGSNFPFMKKSTTLYTCCIISLYVIIMTCFIEDLL
jgi:hypothetical protein